MTIRKEEVATGMAIAPPGQRANEAGSGAGRLRLEWARPTDLPTLMEMYNDFSPGERTLGLPPADTLVRRRWLERLLTDGLNLTARLDGATVSHAALVATAPGRAELAIFVHPRFRRRGVGTALVRMLVATARGAGLQRLAATVGSENVAALRLLRRCGFRTVGWGWGELYMARELQGASGPAQAQAA